MDILEAIERVSKAIEALSNEVRELKSMASGAFPSGPYSLRAECREPDDQVKIVLSYLAMSPGMEKDELLNTLLTCAMNVVRAEGAGLCLYEDKKDVLVFRAAVGIAADQIIGFEVPLTNSQHGIAFRMRQVISSTPMNRAIDATTGNTIAMSWLPPFWSTTRLSALCRPLIKRRKTSLPRRTSRTTQVLRKWLPISSGSACVNSTSSR